MARISVKQRLRRPYVNYLVFELILLIPYATVLTVHASELLLGRRGNWAPLRNGAVICLGLCGLVCATVWRMVQINDHPDLVALTRYGELEGLLAHIEEELNDPAQAGCIGQM